VCEAGWSEKHTELMDDARLWLLHTAGQTCLVIILSFTETTVNNALPALGAEGEVASEASPGSQDEKTIIDSIDEATNLNDLANKLFELNQAGQLSRPLVGNLGATIYGYRASEDGLDIVPKFEQTLLPQPEQEEDGGTLTDFPLTMRDLLGENLPEGQNPEEKITLSLTTLLKLIERSIPRTARVRASRRAEMLLRKAGVWEEETFAQCKRRRLNRSRV